MKSKVISCSRVLVPLLVALASLLSEPVLSCSCMMYHPQEHYCRADYVIVGRVKMSTAHKNHTNVGYNLKINKIFKVNEKSTPALKQNLLLTASQQGLCGVSLHPGTKYLLAGRVIRDQLWINTCNFYQEWNGLSLKQKKGFRLLYQHGCECKVVPCPWWSRSSCRSNANVCLWTTAHEGSKFDCQGSLSICMRGVRGRCEWNQSRAYRACVKERREHRERELAKEP